MTDGWSVLVQGGVVLPTSPGPASAFLRSATPGAYTTTRTACGASSLLLWDRHLARLSESLELLATAFPHLYPSFSQDVDVKRLVQPSVMVGLAQALQLRRGQEEISLTVLLCASEQTPPDLAASVGEVYVHASNYNPVAEGKVPLATSVAVMGPGRTLARAKYSLWASTRQALEKMRPARTSEIILSNDGDSLLEGTLTNFFVVAKANQNVQYKSEDHTCLEQDDSSSVWNDVEVQTAALEDGVLPGIIRRVCRESGIPVRELAPSWACRHTWREAFVTSSVRILQPVVNIQMPTIWTFEPSPRNMQGNSWQHLELQACGMISRKINKLVLERARQESISITGLIGSRATTNKT